MFREITALVAVLAALGVAAVATNPGEKSFQRYLEKNLKKSVSPF